MYVEPIAHLTGMSATEVVRFVEQHFGPLQVEVYVGHRDIAPADVTFATNWPTAAIVAPTTQSLFKLYLIQDFEPDFYEPEDVEALTGGADVFASSGSRLLRKASLGGGCARNGQEHSGRSTSRSSRVFRMTVAPSARPEPVKVLFYARPDQPRRGYDLGIRALEQVKRERPDVEVMLFGSSDEDLGHLPVAARNLGTDRRGASGGGAERGARVPRPVVHEHLARPVRGDGVRLRSRRGRRPVGDGVATRRELPRRAPEAGEVAETVLRLVRDRDLRALSPKRGTQTPSGATWERSGSQLEQILRETCFVRLPGQRRSSFAGWTCRCVSDGVPGRS